MSEGGRCTVFGKVYQVLADSVGLILCRCGFVACTNLYDMYRRSISDIMNMEYALSIVLGSVISAICEELKVQLKSSMLVWSFNSSHDFPLV